MEVFPSDPDIKKQSLRQITCGLHVLSAQSEEAAGAGTVNWLSQASFDPPLIMAAAKADSGLHSVIEKSGAFAVNFLSADQKDMAQDFFRPTEVAGNKINGMSSRWALRGRLYWILSMPMSNARCRKR